MTPTDAIHFVHDAMTFAAGFLRDAGCLRPMIVILATRNPQTLEPLQNPIVVPIAYGGADSYEGERKGKQDFAAFARKTAAELGAIGIVYMTEAWAVVTHEGVPVKRPKGGLGTHPDRTEAIVVTLEHRAFPGQIKTWVGPIKRDANGSPRVEDFVENLPTQSFDPVVNMLAPQN